MRPQARYTEPFFDPATPCHRRLYLLGPILWALVRPDPAIRTWPAIAALLLQGVRFVWRNGILIFLTLLPILLLAFMDQGKDLIRNLFDPVASGMNAGDYVRIVWFLAMLVLQAYAIWVIPRFYIHREMRIRMEMASGAYQRGDHPVWLHTSSNFLRVMAILPFILYGLLFLLRMLEAVEERPGMGYWAINIILGLFLLAGGICLVYGMRRMRHLAWFLLLGLLVTPVIFAAVLGLRPSDPAPAYAILGNSLWAIAILIFGILHRWERRFDQAPPERAQHLEHQADRIYRWVGWAVLAKVILLAFWPNTLRMTTIPLLIFLMAAYILAINWLVYKYRDVRVRHKVLILAAGLVVLVLVALFPSNAHYVWQVPQAPEHAHRPDYHHYQEMWLQRVATDSVPVIYLVAGEGGGSRAAYWTTRILGKLDSLADYRFADRVFAVSTVSGSSAGIASWFKWLRFRTDVGMSRADRDRITASFSANAFGYNFVSGSVIHLLVNDLLKNILPVRFRKDRNYRLQQEENAGFLRAIGGETFSIQQTLPGMAPDHPDCPDSGLGPVEDWHFLPLNQFYRQGQEVDLRWPLLFFNTTQMRTGRRAVVAPVQLDEDVFFDAFDVLADWGKTKPDSLTLALGTAANLSELFPVFSAFTYVDGVGNLMDGGGYENKGLTTILEVYTALRAQLDRDSLPTRIVLLALENGGSSDADSTKALHQAPAMLLQAASQPFASQSAAARNRAVRLLHSHPRDTLLFISLKNDLPLARDLSRRSIQRMDSLARKEVEQVRPSLHRIDPDLFSDEKGE